jgi:phage repressor protein C with HTH and peptisase S24 domain
MTLTPQIAAVMLRTERKARRISTQQMADMIREYAATLGSDVRISQQTVSAFEQGSAKRIPDWWGFAMGVFERVGDAENVRQLTENYVQIAELPTYAGAGGGGTGEGDHGSLAFSRSLVEHELRASPADLLAVTIEGNSMSPDFQSGDQLLIDKRKTSLAQPGAFCLWDGDGYVVKYIERVPGAEPPRVRVISANTTFSTFERLVEEVRIMGRVVWLARRV